MNPKNEDQIKTLDNDKFACIPKMCRLRFPAKPPGFLLVGSEILKMTPTYLFPKREFQGAPTH